MNFYPRLYEAIKHLAPRSQEELRAMFNKLSPLDKLESYKRMGIKLSNAEKLDLFHLLSPNMQLEVYKNLDIELSEKEIEDILDELTPNGMARFAIEHNKPDIYRLALDKGHKMTEADKNIIIRNQRHFDQGESSWNNRDWSDIVNKYINVSKKEKIIDRDPEENRKDYNNARKKIAKLNEIKDITTLKQEQHLTMMFELVNARTEKFSLTKNGYVRRHWKGYVESSSPIIENPYLTFSAMADILIKYLYKNKYIN
jgi:hypothetical protein